MADVLAGCPDQDLPRDVPPAAGAAGPSPADEVYYADCAAVRVAGAAPLRADQPGYRPALDRGGAENLACE